MADHRPPRCPVARRATAQFTPTATRTTARGALHDNNGVPEVAPQNLHPRRPYASSKCRYVRPTCRGDRRRIGMGGELGAEMALFIADLEERVDALEGA